MEDHVSPIRQEQLRAEELTGISRKIMDSVRNELYLHMRYLDATLHGLSLIPDFSIGSGGSDGTFYFYNPEYLGRMYQRGRVLVNRCYLHTLLHCLFCHMYIRKKRDRQLWDLSCDIAIESLIDSLHYPCVHLRPSPRKRELYDRIKEEQKVLNAEAVYYCLESWNIDDRELQSLAACVCVDDHSFWKNEEDGKSEAPRQQWDDKRKTMEVEMEAFSDEASESAGELFDQVRIENRERYDYREFLRKFSVWKEAVMIDPDSFDYIYYDYGMRTFGNMPLIEPMETKEVRGIEDFVIVVDTSMSCQGELIKTFLEETYTILSETETYFNKVNIHIIQCDDKVREDQLISSREELIRYMEDFQVRGQGGTDFRPAFYHVDQLIHEGAFTRLKGLIYFTDGYGMFPVRMPAYDVAFVFLEQSYREEDVPPWAMRIVLDPGTLGRMKEEIHEKKR